MRTFFQFCYLLLSCHFTLNAQIIKSITVDTTYTLEAGTSTFTHHGYIVTGKYERTGDVVNFIANYDNFGHARWASKISDSGISTVVSLTELSTGDLVFLSENISETNYYTLFKTDSLANFIWAVNLDKTLFDSYETPVVKTDESNNLYVLSSTYDKTHVFKINPFGSLLWSRTISVDEVTYKNPGFDFEILNDGGILFCGKADLDLFFVRIDALGNLLWTKRMNDNGNSYALPKAITLLQNGNLLVAGFRGSNVFPFESGPFVIKLDDSGNILNYKFYLDTLGDYSFIPALIHEMDDLSVKIMGNGGPLTFVDLKQDLSVERYSYWSYLTNAQTYNSSFDIHNTSFIATCSDRKNTQFILRNDISKNDFCNLSSITSIKTKTLPIKNDLYTHDINFTSGPGIFSSAITLIPLPDFTYDYLCGSDETVLTIITYDSVDEYSIFPNPVSQNGQITVRGPNNFSYSLVDLTGKIILQGETLTGLDKIKIPEINQGTYILLCSSPSKEYRKQLKLVVTR